jgi:hypothetical protein
VVKILDVGDYIDEIGLTVRPVLEMLYELNKDNNFTFETVQKFYFGTLGQWDQINRFFLNHKRSIRRSESARPESQKINATGSAYPMISKLRMISESLKLVANNMPDGNVSGSAFDGFVSTVDDVADRLTNQ